MSGFHINSLDEAVQAGQDVVHGESSALWVSGDLANLVMGRYGPKSKVGTMTLRDFATRIGIGYRILADRARVCRYVEQALRDDYASLLFSHWKAMVQSGLRGDELRNCARETHDNEWTVTGLQSRLKTTSQGKVDAYRWLRGAAKHVSEVELEDIRAAIENHPQEVAESWATVVRGLEEWDREMEVAGVEL